MNKSLNPQEVFDIADKVGKMMTMDDVSGYSTVEELFGDLDNILLIYLTNDNYGHWCCMNRDGRTVNFFDSYGMYPDDQLDKIPEDFKMRSNQDFPHLLSILADYDGVVHYNERQYQKYDNDITTCGRWCGFFMRCSTSMKDFQYLVKEYGISDEEIVKITDFLLEM